MSKPSVPFIETTYAVPQTSAFVLTNTIHFQYCTPHTLHEEYTVRQCSRVATAAVIIHSSAHFVGMCARDHVNEHVCYVHSPFSVSGR